MPITIIKADYSNEKHRLEIPYLLNTYACDPMGGGEPLKEEVMETLADQLSQQSNAFSLIAYEDEKPIGLANCFFGFSTFSCKPLVNIHDIAVLKESRGKGVGKKLLEEIEAIAIEKGCCKITLEVLSNNEVAKAAYKNFGFSDYTLTSNLGGALFWQKAITSK